MSQENVEVVKRAIDAFNRRDLDSFDEICDADIELSVPMVDTPDSFRGREGIELFYGRFPQTWEEYGMLTDEVRSVGERVLVLGRASGRERESGVPVEMPLAWVFELRGGRVSRARAYLDHAEALEAAGLTE
jgi:ketosteroid isomerase-like protein